MNRVQLTGNLTRDPVYIDITAWNALAETCGQYLTKGRHIAISGRLDHQEWTADDGAKRSRHLIVADEIDFLDHRNDDE